MEAITALGLLAPMTAFASAYFMTSSIWANRERKWRYRQAQAAKIDGNGERRVSSLLRNGSAIAIPFARFLLKNPRINRLTSDALGILEDHGFFATQHGLLSVLIVILIILVLAVSLIAGSAVCGLAVAACVCAILVVRVNTLSDKRKFELRQSVPDALTSMQTCFQSGYSLLQTFQQVAAETKGPLGELFAHSAHQLQMGSTATEVLDCFRAKASIQELSFVAVALDVQHQAGGSLREVLDSAREMIEDELELSRKLRVQTAQAKLSARVVTVIPFVLIAVFSLISDGFLVPFFGSFGGLALLILACGMQLAGVLIVRRMLKVKE